MKLKNVISSKLIMLSATLICLTVLLVAFAHNAISSLKNDAYIINSAGIVRGSIQRLSKLELSGCDYVCTSLHETIEKHIKEIKELTSSIDSRYSQSEFTERFNKLDKQWKQLSILFELYREHPSKELANQIVQMSEHCWEIADAAVLFAQLTAEDKVGSFRYLYPLTFLIVVFNCLMIFLVYREVGVKLEHLATYDDLTNVYNRYTFNRILLKEIKNAELYYYPLSLIYFDIDYFKKVNDRFGHQVGDDVLKEVGELIVGCVRSGDSVARIGGEEFAVITPGADQEQSLLLAQKIRIKIEAHRFNAIGRLTASAGVAPYRKGMDAKDLIAEADKALYQAKEKGRNNVVSFPVVIK